MTTTGNSPFNYTNLGQSQLSSDIQALFRDQFVPLLLTTFDEKRVLKGLVRNKTITKGKSASFPLFGTVKAEYIGRGKEVQGMGNFAKSEVTINIDPWLVSHQVLDQLEEKMSETQDRAIIADQMAMELANTEDKQLLQVGVLAARSASLITGENRGGSVIYAGSNVVTSADVLAKAIYAGGVELDEKNIPEDNRTVYIRPLQYSLLCQYSTIIDRNTGAGSFPKGVTGKIDNMNVVKTTHLPKTNITAGEGTNPNNTYTGDFTNTAALVMHRDAIATVNFMGLITECTYQPKSFDHLLTARIAQGHGFLRPECAVEISKAAGASSGSGT